MIDDVTILNDYREAFAQYARTKGTGSAPILDFDVLLKQKFLYQAHRYPALWDISKGHIPVNRISHFCLVLVTTGGGGEKQVGHFTFPVRDNTLWIIPSRTLNASYHFPPETDGYMLSFDREFFLQQSFPRHYITDKAIFKSFIRPYLYLTPDEARKVSHIFEELLEEHQSDHTGKIQLVAIKTLELLLICERFFTQSAGSPEEKSFNSTIEKFNALLDAHFAQEKSVKFYSDALSIHPNYLNTIVKRHTGLSTKEIIQQKLLMEAKYLLNATDMSIKQIAYELGFEDQNYFSRFFKKATHHSALAYRQHPV